MAHQQDMYPLTKPEYDHRELEAVKEVFDSGWLIDGPKVREFEGKICDYTGAKYAVATSSCTTALETAIEFLTHTRGHIAVSPRDTIIVPSFGWIATANAVRNAGYKPIFVDVAWNGTIDTSKIEAAIQENTIAIIAVHNCGVKCDINNIHKIASQYNLAVIEDSAGALGIPTDNKSLCSCYSFHPRKVITTGEGGMITTNNKHVAEFARSYIYHGASKLASDLTKSKSLSAFQITGNNYRMTNMQGALGCVQMDKLKDIIRNKLDILNLYVDELYDIVKGKVCLSQNHSIAAFELDYDSSDVISKLLEAGIQSRPLSHSAPLEPCYGYKPEHFPEAFRLTHNTFCLPLYCNLTDNDIKYIITKTKEILGG